MKVIQSHLKLITVMGALCAFALTAISQREVAATSFTTTQTVDFEKHIRPILEEKCSKCHGTGKQQSGFRVDQRGALLKGGSSGLPAGALPSHPELLDYLAAEFVKPQDSGAKSWSVKDLIRRIVMTDAFRQSSAPREDGLRADAGDTLLWRFAPRRVEAEVIRDAVLQASGKLDLTIGGRGYRIHNVKKTYAQWEVVDNHGPQTWRRMLYQERMRRVDDQIFTAFDFPDCGQVRPRRLVSTTPLQALNLMNSDFVVEQANLLAQCAVQETSPVDFQAQVQRCFQLLLNRQPSDADLAARIASYKLAGKMQMSVPKVMDLANEPESIHKEYGLDTGTELKREYAKNCILARRH